MGRYYSGDIEGKFWFAVQSSDAPSRFGGQECELNCMQYYFEESDIEGLEKELDAIEKEMGGYLEKFEKFFSEHDFYSNEKLEVAVGLHDKKIVRGLLSEYADYTLGVKILNCVKENGSCTFDAEL